MKWVCGILFCYPVGERGNLARAFYYWQTEELEYMPSNDIIEVHVWEKYLGYSGITFSSFYTLPLDMVERMGERVTSTDISDDLEELGEMYRGEW